MEAPPLRSQLILPGRFWDEFIEDVPFAPDLEHKSSLAAHKKREAYSR